MMMIIPKRRKVVMLCLKMGNSSVHMDVVKLIPRRPRLITDIGEDAKVNFYTSQEEEHNTKNERDTLKVRY